jgi:glycosyltransferase A (GT-A) superfamily protein (DUF2064 family)
MLNASLHVFSKGFEKIVIIGSDCFELTEALINKSFTDMEQNDVIIGPAKDGGYYLLGMKKLYPYLFFDKSWSSEKLLKETIKETEEHGLSVSLLPPLNDLDVLADLPDSLRTEFKAAFITRNAS